MHCLWNYFVCQFPDSGYFSATWPLLTKYDEKRYVSQFVSEMFDSLQKDSNKGAPQYELKSFVTMATYWVPDLPKLKSISGHLQHSIFIFLNGAPYAWSHRHINMLHVVAQVCGPIFQAEIRNILKSSGWGLEKTELPWEKNFYSCRCVFCRTISLPSFNGLRCKLAKIALFIYLR